MGTSVRTVNTSKDQRFVTEGGIQNLVAPDSIQSGGPTISASDSAVNQTVNLTGLGTDDINTLLAPIFAAQSDERDTFEGLANKLASSNEGLANSVVSTSAVNQQKLTDAIAATKAPTQSQLQAFIPLLIIMVVLYFLFGGKL